MKLKLLFALFCLSVIPDIWSQEIGGRDADMPTGTADADGIVWHDPRTPPFRIVGFPWIGKDKVYRRLPITPSWKLGAAVDGLASSTAGGQIHFQSDSPRILVRVQLLRASGMDHMPATGESGFDLYVGTPGAQKYFRTARFDASATSYEVSLFEGTQENRHFTLNFPLYNGVGSVEVGVVEGSSITATPAFSHEGRVVVYGTSITQGGCAARPGMAYTNILSRRLDADFVNLGFSGSGLGEPALAHLINEIEGKALVVLDYEANANESIRETLGPFVDILREEDSALPVLVISKIPYAAELNHPAVYQVARDRAQFQRRFVEQRRAAGDANIHFLDGETLLGERPDEGTVDGVHPTALGFMNMANGIEPAIRSILKW